MQKFLFAAAAAMAMLATADSAKAQAPNPFGCKGQMPIFKSLFHPQPLPAFQAAPWYLYWPYNSHFQTAAPMINAPYAAPPGSGGAGYQINPYFPQQPYGAPGYDYLQPAPRPPVRETPNPVTIVPVVPLVK